MNRKFSGYLLGFCLVLLTIPIQAPAAPVAVQKLVNWEDIVHLSRENNLPVVILVDQWDCPYCDIVEQEFLEPMLRGGQFDQLALIRKISIDQGEMITDQEGKSISAREFARRYADSFTPTILFLDCDAQPIGENIVGVNSTDFYGYYLDKAIVEAHAQFNN